MRFYNLAVVWILVMILIAHRLVPAPYDWTRNSISELADLPGIDNGFENRSEQPCITNPFQYLPRI